MTSTLYFKKRKNLAKKKKTPQAIHAPTKRQLSHWQKQKQRQRIILGIGITIIAAVFIIIGTGVYRGWYLTEYKPLHETVLVVNGTKYNMDYYIKAVELQSQGQVNYIQYFLDPVVTSLEKAEITRQEALKLGISVSEDEIDNELKTSTAETKAEPAIRDYVRNYLLNQKLAKDYFGPKVAATADQRQIMAMLLESQSQATEVKARITAGEDFMTVAAELSLETTTKNDSGDLGWRPKGVLQNLVSSSVLEEAVFNQTVGTIGQVFDSKISKSTGYWLVKVTGKEEATGKVHVFGMLLSSEEQAKSVNARLDAGEDFSALAQELSLKWDETNKDDLGWIGSDSTDVIKDYIFSPDTLLNVVSPIIKDANATTLGGCWLYKVLDSGERELSSDDRDILVNKLYTDWIGVKTTEYQDKIVNSMDTVKKNFATNRIQADLGYSG
jgi:parvulin-like peptidyl-prolyl isomerase